MTRIQLREDRSCDSGRHSSSAEQLHIDKVATEENEIGVEGSSFSDDAPEARDVVGMRASMKIREKNYSERTGPSRPTIDYQPQFANYMRTRPRNPLKPTLSAEFVSEGWSRKGADQATPQNPPTHIPIHRDDSHQTDDWRAPFVETLK